MEPSLLAGDFVVVSKLPIAHPKRGEVFAFHVPAGVDPGRGELVFVKRCVAVPGDSVFVAGGVIWVNGVRADPPGMGASPGANPASPAGIHGTLVIPRPGDNIELSDSVLVHWHSLIEREGHRLTAGASGEVLLDGRVVTSYHVEQRHYFVAGDNRSDSYDSRFWGLLPETAILGRAVLIYWSWDDRQSAIRWGRIGAIAR
jgi:signal peptidase I